MIFVTVGLHYQGFERLIKKMDEIATNIKDEVIMQIGHTSYKPKNAKWFTFLEKEEDILDLYKKSNIIIAHGGAGTLLTALTLKKSLIVVPRLKKFNEHIDDQQLELAKALESKNQAFSVYNLERLEEKIECAKSINLTKKRDNKELVNFLRDYLKEIEKCI